jgi:tetratricopeptide (TPR) repeat protein
METKSSVSDNALTKKAWEALQNNSFEEAIKHFKGITDDNPKDAVSWYGWGVALMNQGKFEEAIIKFTVSLNHEPGMEAAIHNLGYCYVQLGEYKRALHYLDKIYLDKKEEPLNTRNLKLYRLRAYCYLQLHHYAWARQEYDKAITIQPDNNYKAYFERGIVKIYLHLPFEAYQDFQTALMDAQKFASDEIVSDLRRQINPWIETSVAEMRKLQEESNKLNNAVRKTLEAFY